MQHAVLGDIMSAVSTFEKKAQADAVPHALNTLLSQYADALNIVLAGTGRSVTFDSHTRSVTVNGGTASGGYGPIESTHAYSITSFLSAKVLAVWRLGDTEQEALREIATLIERGARTDSGNLHTFTIEDRIIGHDALAALQGALDIISARLHEAQRLKNSIVPLKESIASLMERLDIQRGIPSSKGIKNIPFAQVAHSDYQKIQAALRAKGISGEHADVHLGLILIDLVNASHEKVTFQKPAETDEEADDEEPEFGEYRSIEDVEIAAMRYTEHVHDIIMQLEERSAVKTIGGFLVADLEREESSVERLFGVVERLAGAHELDSVLRAQYEHVKALVEDAHDRTSTDTVRFASARAGLIAFRDALTAAQKDQREKVESDIKKREALLSPITQLAQRIESTLSQADVRGENVHARYTGKELALLDEAKKILDELNTIRRGVFPDVHALEEKLRDEGLSDTAVLTEHVEAMIARVLKIFEAPRQRQEKAQKAFEYLAEGVLETATYHRVRFERIDNRITFHIPTAIATVVQDARLVDQIHSGTYKSLAEAIRYANSSLIISESRITGIEERASEASIDDTLARMERSTHTRESVRSPYRSLRTKVSRVVAAMLGGTFGLFVQIPDAPQKEPMVDVDSKRDAQPAPDTGIQIERQSPEAGLRDSKSGVTVTIPSLGTLPERTMTVEVPRPSFVLSPTVPKELDAQMAQLQKAFTAPVTSEHGTYGLLKLVRAYVGDTRTLTPDERKATDWFTHAFARFINELPEERIAQLVPNVRLQKGVIASTIPSRVGGVPVQIDYSAVLKTKDFWKWFDSFYAKRKSTSLAQPGLQGVAMSIDTLTAKLKGDFKVNE